MNEVQPHPTVGQMLGEIVWLMTQSPIHRERFISELETSVLRPLSLNNYRLYKDDSLPRAVVFWAKVSDEVQERLKQGNARLKAEDWNSGNHYWVVDIVTPFGQAEKIIQDLQKQINPEGSVFFLRNFPDGTKQVEEVTMSETSEDDNT